MGSFQGLCSPYKKSADKYTILEQHSDFTFYTFSKIMKKVSIFHIFIENENMFNITLHVESRYVKVRKFFMHAFSNVLSFLL